jgi:hypothetical protein
LYPLLSLAFIFAREPRLWFGRGRNVGDTKYCTGTAIPTLRAPYHFLKMGFIRASSGTPAGDQQRLFESFPKLAEQGLGVVQIDCIEAFAEPLVDWQEKGASRMALIPIAKKPRHVDRGTQFQRLRLLHARNC